MNNNDLMVNAERYLKSLSKHSLGFYRLLSPYLDKKENSFKMTIDELKSCLGIPQHTYARRSDVDKQLIKVTRDVLAKKEVLFFDYNMIKRKKPGEKEYLHKVEFIVKDGINLQGIISDKPVAKVPPKPVPPKNVSCDNKVKIKEVKNDNVYYTLVLCFISAMIGVVIGYTLGQM